MPWQEYEAIVSLAWNKLLADPDISEMSVQRFLEHHPCLVPGAFGTVGVSGHAPFPGALICKPALPDFTRRIPDFMWIARNSVVVSPVLIEIESPNKRWFTKGGQQSAELTQAIGQLTEWRCWFDEPLNRARFTEYYKLPLNGRQLRPEYVLIYGRHAEAGQNSQLIKKRGQMARPNETLMTYDRLRPDPNVSDFLSAKLTRSGYEAICLPATMCLGPAFAELRVFISGKKDAAMDSPYLSRARSKFLCDRLDYWDCWISENARGVSRHSDRE